MTRVAALDCGTNSLRLLIADPDPATGTMHELTRQMEIVRLGQGVDRTGQIDPAAMARTLEVTRDFAEQIRAAGAQSIRFVATSATRDARNRDEFTDGVVAALGVSPDVLSGDEEAKLSFDGATRSVAAQHPAPFLVVDPGGGSTEFVLGTDGVQAGISTDIGCVRLTERYGAGDALVGERREAVQADIDAAIAAAQAVVPFAQARTLVGLAGSVTTVTAHALGLTQYDSSRIDGSQQSLSQVRQACESLIQMPREQRAALGFMHPGRVDVIGVGALIWLSVAEAVAAAAGPDLQIVTSERDILDGIAWSLA